MGISQEHLCSLKKEVTALIISCVTLYGFNGLPLKKLNREFETYSGYPIPYEKFGCDSLRSFLMTIPKIFIRRDGDYDEEIVVAESNKSMHMKQLISRQKNQVTRKRTFECYTYNSYESNDSYNSHYYNNNSNSNSNKKRRFASYAGDNNYAFSVGYPNESVSERLNKFQKLEAMLPLFYKHQALGDDFFLDIADTKMGYYVPKNGPKECGLCVVGQTIAQLKERVKNAEFLAPRVVVMIGFNDLLLGRNANNMILDMRELIIELKKRNTMISLVTLIQSPKLPKNEQIEMRMDIFNKALMEYANDNQLQCNVIDMNATLCSEAKNFRKDFDRLEKVARTDPYKVFSDYGRKVFLSTLKSSLRELIEAGN